MIVPPDELVEKEFVLKINESLLEPPVVKISKTIIQGFQKYVTVLHHYRFVRKTDFNMFMLLPTGNILTFIR